MLVDDLWWRRHGHTPLLLHGHIHKFVHVLNLWNVDLAAAGAAGCGAPQYAGLSWLGILSSKTHNDLGGRDV